MQLPADDSDAPSDEVSAVDVADEDVALDGAAVAFGPTADSNDVDGDGEVGALLAACRRIVGSPAFVALTDGFVRSHCDVFDEDEDGENKLEYTALHEQYIELVEAEMVAELHDRFADLSMAAFLEALPAYVERHGDTGTGGTAVAAHADAADDDGCANVPATLEVLNRFTSFRQFKRDMIAARRRKRVSDEAVAAGAKLYFSVLKR